MRFYHNDKNTNSYTVKILSGQGNHYEILLPGGKEAEAYSLKKFIKGQYAWALKTSSGIYTLIGRRTFSYIPKIKKYLAVLTYDEFDNYSEKILLLNKKTLEIVGTFTETGYDGIIPQDVAGIQNFTYENNALVEFTDSEYQNTSIVASSEQEGYEVINLLDFEDLTNFWRAGETGGPHVLTIETPVNVFALKILRTNENDRATVFDINSEIYENNYIEEYTEVFYHGEVGNYIELEVTEALDGANSTSIQKIYLYARSPDYETVHAAFGMLQYEEGTLTPKYDLSNGWEVQ